MSPTTPQEFLKLLESDAALESSFKQFIDSLDSKVSDFLHESLVRWVREKGISIDRLSADQQAEALSAYFQRKRLKGIFIRLFV